jgi:hypothetical protein
MIKGIGKAVVEEISRAREGHPFSSLFDFCNRCDPAVVTKSALEALVDCGAFDSLGKRSVHRVVVPQALDAAQKIKKQKENGQIALFGLPEHSHTAEPILLPDLPELPDEELASLERQYLGIALTSSPFSKFAKILEKVVDADTASLPKTKSRSFTIAGAVTRVRSLTTKNNEPMMFFTLEDEKGAVDATVFPDVYRKYAHLIQREQLVVIKAQTDRKANGGPDELPKIICLEVLELPALAAKNAGLREEAVKYDVAPVESKGGNGVERNNFDVPLLPGEGKDVMATQNPEPKESGPTTVLISLPESEVTESKLLQVRDILLSHPGLSPVLLRVKQGDDRPLLLDLGCHLTTDHSQMTSALVSLRSLLGLEAVSFMPLGEQESAIPWGVEGV